MGKRVALITGGSRGIGRAIAIGLAAAGHRVLINFRSRREEAEQTLGSIVQHGGDAELCPFDVSDGGACEKAVADALARHGKIDILVNNAGIRADSLLVFMKPEQWSDVIGTNLNSFFNVTRPIVKQMAMNRWGRIVTIASTSGLTGVEGQVNYSAAKAGIIGASKSLAREVAKRGVTVNVLAPGFIETDMISSIPREQLVAQIPAGRLGRPDEVAGMAVFLTTDAAAYITGTVININGGAFT